MGRVLWTSQSHSTERWQTSSGRFVAQTLTRSWSIAPTGDFVTGPTCGGRVDEVTYRQISKE